jgi:hypothetical protein
LEVLLTYVSELPTRIGSSHIPKKLVGRRGSSQVESCDIDGSLDDRQTSELPMFLVRIFWMPIRTAPSSWET